MTFNWNEVTVSAQTINHKYNAIWSTVKILKFGTPQTIAIIVLKIAKFDVTLH